MKKFIRIIALAAALMFVFAGCGTDKISKNDIDGYSDISSQNVNQNKVTEPLTKYVPEMKNFSVDGSNEETSVDTAEHSKVKFTMENGGYFVIELYPEYAPETCANFLKLVNEGFYDGLTFHRIIDGFMAQGGDPEGTGSGGSDEKIHGEFYANGFTQNTISHTRGVVSMARRGDSYDSASSQFFICYSDDYTRSLDGGYAAFGLVTEGMEVVDAFLEIERTVGGDGELSKPVTPIVIEKAEVIS